MHQSHIDCDFVFYRGKVYKHLCEYFATINKMRNAILVHGWAHKDEYYEPKYPTSSNSHWLPWLSKQLMIRDIHTIAVEMPSSYYPDYLKWKIEFERYEITPETILVGHSCGGGFLIRWLSENKDKRVNKLILVAPWVGTEPDQPFDNTFFEFEWDNGLHLRTNKLIMFSSTNDVKSVKDSEEIIKHKLQNLKTIGLENKGHFTLQGLGSVEFPELLEMCLD